MSGLYMEPALPLLERDSYRAVALNDIMVQGMGLKSTRRTIKEVASQSLAKAKSRLSSKKMFELPNSCLVCAICVLRTTYTHIQRLHHL